MKNTSQFESFTEQVGTVAFATFLVGISIIGAFANIVVIVSIVANDNLRTKTNYVVLSLAMSDFLGATVGIPLRLLEHVSSSNRTLVSCNIVLALTLLFDGVSRLNIVLISFDRFMAVKYPFTYAKLSPQKATLIAITSFWTVMLAFAICILSGVGPRDEGTGEDKETTDMLISYGKKSSRICFLSSTLSKAAILTFTLGIGAFPIIIVAPINVYLIKTSFWHIKRIQDLHTSLEANSNLHGADGKDENNRGRQRRTVTTQRHGKRAKMVAILVCLYLVLVAPISVIDIIETLTNISVPSYVSKTALILIYLNTAVNMFVYAAFNREFREAFIRIFVKMFRNRCSKRR